ncbi:hypothetical protein CO661_33335 [Sinorhizobium fredii]|uniref:Uncharacterized protein n=1 Tax=Rhizobium fredii TaxID=380 RepID=A0A2A6LME1_RHIFR|nr:hypothetical protein CO661_33335 [Sinorhizobium fredii]
MTLMMHPLGFQGSLNCYRFCDTHDLLGDGGIDASSTESETTWQSEHKIGPVATIHRAARRETCIHNCQPSPAPAAGQHAG